MESQLPLGQAHSAHARVSGATKEIEPRVISMYVLNGRQNTVESVVTVTGRMAPGCWTWCRMAVFIYLQSVTVIYTPWILPVDLRYKFDRTVNLVMHVLL